MLERLIQWDKDLFLWLNSHHSELLDRMMWFISGKWEWIPLYLFLAGWLVYRFRYKSIPFFLAILLALVVTDLLAVHAFKEVVERLRPSHNPEFVNSIHLVRDYHGGNFGFVSNHSANSFCLATLLSLIFRNPYFTPGIFLWAALVSYSRIYLGVHYPADIFGGAILGAGIASLFYFVLMKFMAGKWYRSLVKEAK
ncbi:MAG: phosphatase PAP2 family protein [Bacteroidales bacterium]|nr:phosphatase PAP2 family protein [Bacteroidales bacterium]